MKIRLMGEFHPVELAHLSRGEGLHVKMCRLLVLQRGLRTVNLAVVCSDRRDGLHLVQNQLSSVCELLPPSSY